jgi:uncharacterized protein (TIGR02145 family)
MKIQIQFIFILLLSFCFILLSGCKKEEADPPTVSTSQVSDVSQNSAVSGGEISSDGGAEIISKGIVWGDFNNPTIEDNIGFTDEGSGSGIFSSNITGLDPATTYYVRAYATNSAGTAYGFSLNFTSLEEEEEEENNYTSYTDPRDAYVYKTIVLGNQEWFAENLRYLPSVVSPTTGSYTEAFFYVFGYYGTNVSDAKASEHYETYGVLYNWHAAMNGASSSNLSPSGVQGICPEGWHLPSDAEWDILSDYLIANNHNYDGTTTGNKIAKSLASTTNWTSSETAGAVGNNLDANNSSGFNALPSGQRNTSSQFNQMGLFTYWWSATQETAGNAWQRSLIFGSHGLNRDDFNKAAGFSVRCVKD